MKIDLSGKTALVTGSTKGIGFAAARALAAAGAAVIVNGRSQAGVDQAIQAIHADAAGVEARGVVADLSGVTGCQALIDGAGTVDILVNNAAIFHARDFFDITDAEWTETMELNVLAGMRLARAVLPGMAERNWGRVIFISSESGLNIPTEMLDYGVSKTAMLGLSRGLAKRMAGTNVTVNAVLPGPTTSEGVAVFMKEKQAKTGKSLEATLADFIAEHRPSSITRRASTVEEVANMIVYVASPLSSATTGAALRVDGGVVDTIA